MKKATDGTVVIGRSHEYSIPVPASLAVLPVGYVGSGLVPDGADSSASWVSKYGIVGIAALGNPAWLLDGMNTAGVSVHALAMPNGFGIYPQPKRDGTDLSMNDVIAFLLGNCASVAEAKDAAGTINVWGKDTGMGFVPPMHFLIHDADSSASVEFHDGVTLISDNPTGVGTNAPYLDWHLTNLNNYVGLQSTGHQAVDALGSTFAPFGVGDGLIGMPGDYTGPGRFVRAAAMVALSPEPADSTGAEMQTLHMLNAFDIPTGIFQKEIDGQLHNETTQWVTLSNLTAQRYSYRTENDPTIYVVELDGVNFKLPARSLPMSAAQAFTAVTP